MFAKRLLHKAVHHSQNLQRRKLTEADLNLQIIVHYGIPSTSSLLAFDPIQRLLAIGTLDGRIKVIGGDGIEGLLISPKQLPFKYIEFLQNQGYLVTILNDNDIQVWNLESRCIVCSLQWKTNVTSFSAIHGSSFMYIGDEYGSMSVMKYNVEEEKILQLPYNISSNTIGEATECPFSSDQPIVGVLPQPYSSGSRVLIAYQNGLIALWDVFAARIIFSGGGKDLQLKEDVVEASGEANVNSQDDTRTQHLGEKEISALCWASSSGSILAVGYVDGDILFWNTSSVSSKKGQHTLSASNSVVKLQLSSVERRLPVIVLHWSATNKTSNDCDGQLFIYGGDEIGSEEVLTVLTLEWSSGMDALKCVSRVDITLTGSFADMVLLPSVGPTGSNKKVDVFILTSPGQLHLYDDATISSLISQQERKPSLDALEYPAVIPMNDPTLTAAKFIKLPKGDSSLKTIVELHSGSMSSSSGGTKWPLTGGVPSQLSSTKDKTTERIYLAGYSDGSVRIWDATFPVLSFICLLEAQVQSIKVAGSRSSVSELDFCFHTSSLAVGNECGLVRIYNLKCCPDGTKFHFVTETQREVHNLSQEKGLHCSAIFSLTNSPIQRLQFTHSGAKLAVGFKCGRVAVIDVPSLSVVFFLNDVSSSNSPVISIIWKEVANSPSLKNNTKHSEANTVTNSTTEVMFVLTKDVKISVIDGHNGKLITKHPWNLKKESNAVSMHVIEGYGISSKASNENHPGDSKGDGSKRNEPECSHSIEHDSDSPYSEEISDSFVLLCCEDSLLLYSAKAVIQGNDKPIRKIKHPRPCFWATTFMNDEREEGVVLLFQTGAIEIRSLPDLDLVKESSLMSILRWNFRANMNKMTSSCSNGLITVANASEVAVISLLATENDFRIPESLPCLHDQVLAAAADAALSLSTNQKNKQATTGILGGIVKGLKGGNKDHNVELIKTPKANFDNLEGIFLKSPHSNSSPHVDLQEVEELDIDDIEIDEVPPLASTSFDDPKNAKKGKEKGSERERLFEGGSSDNVTPRLRTPQEIMAAYGKTRDASSAAANARNKLAERQEKLDRMSKRTEELQSGAEDFASMANELVKTLENRKWWQI